jgi:ABC-type lipoprotein release transport system permease subunit
MLEGVLTALAGAVLGWITAYLLIMAARPNFPALA